MRYFSILFLAWLAIGCASARPSVPVDAGVMAVTSDETAQKEEPKKENPKVVKHVPKKRVKWYQKLNPIFWFGNIDDPVAPDWYRPGERHRNAKWYLRNSLHNFTFYVIGIADREFIRRGQHPAAVFNPNDGWNWAVCRYKIFYFPFVSYKKGNFKFYFGWRERGNFGIKLNLPFGKKS